jgi:hypothetical protein
MVFGISLKTPDGESVIPNKMSPLYRRRKLYEEFHPTP